MSRGYAAKAEVFGAGKSEGLRGHEDRNETTAYCVSDGQGTPME